MFNGNTKVWQWLVMTVTGSVYFALLVIIGELACLAWLAWMIQGNEAHKGWWKLACFLLGLDYQLSPVTILLAILYRVI